VQRRTHQLHVASQDPKRSHGGCRQHRDLRPIRGELGRVTSATSFSITDSIFATWGLTGATGTYDAITIAGATKADAAHMSFVISGNTFTNDPDFPGNRANLLRPIRVQGSPFMYFQKFIVTNNISYGSGIVSSANDGIAVTGHSVFANNL
jgi:hypothetical protein